MVPASANFAPELTVSIYEAYRRGDHAMALALQQRLVHIPNPCAIENPFYAMVKEAMRLLSRIYPWRSSRWLAPSIRRTSRWSKLRSGEQAFSESTSGRRCRLVTRLSPYAFL